MFSSSVISFSLLKNDSLRIRDTRISTLEIAFKSYSIYQFKKIYATLE